MSDDFENLMEAQKNYLEITNNVLEEISISLKKWIYVDIIFFCNLPRVRCLYCQNQKLILYFQS